MAFKTATSYNEERFGGFFMLRNDGDYADVVFLYNNKDEVLVAESAHYIKSAEYSGYVHCSGRGCPACVKGIRTQAKLFIPLYNILDNEIQFWDRSMRFEPQLQSDVFANYPNPSDFVFRITRRGAAGDINTTYEMMAIGKNDAKSYTQILSEHNATFPEYYDTVCKEVTPAKMQEMLNVSGNSATSTPSANGLPSYQVQPRQPSAQFAPPSYSENQELPGAVPMPEASSDNGVPFDADVETTEAVEDDVKF